MHNHRQRRSAPTSRNGRRPRRSRTGRRRRRSNPDPKHSSRATGWRQECIRRPKDTALRSPRNERSIDCSETPGSRPRSGSRHHVRSARRSAWVPRRRRLPQQPRLPYQPRRRFPRPQRPRQYRWSRPRPTLPRPRFPNPPSQKRPPHRRRVAAEASPRFRSSSLFRVRMPARLPSPPRRSSSRGAATHSLLIRRRPPRHSTEPTLRLARRNRTQEHACGRIPGRHEGAGA